MAGITQIRPAEMSQLGIVLRLETWLGDFDCHSNETVWPAYAQIAPVSWLIQHDVDEGREKLNFSEWLRQQKESNEAAKSVRQGKMPPWTYTLLHSEARLSAEERSALIRGLEATIGAEASGRFDH
jgi:hypothetical protein